MPIAIPPRRAHALSDRTRSFVLVRCHCRAGDDFMIADAEVDLINRAAAGPRHGFGLACLTSWTSIVDGGRGGC